MKKDMVSTTDGDTKALIEDFITHMEKLGPKLCKLLLEHVIEYQEQGRPVLVSAMGGSLAYVILGTIKHIDKEAHPGALVEFIAGLATQLAPADAKLLFASLPAEVMDDILSPVAEGMRQQLVKDAERVCGECRHTNNARIRRFVQTMKDHGIAY